MRLQAAPSVHLAKQYQLQYAENVTLKSERALGHASAPRGSPGHAFAASDASPLIGKSLSSPTSLDSLSSPALLDSLSSPASLDSLSAPALLDLLSSPALLDSLSSPASLDSLSAPVLLSMQLINDPVTVRSSAIPEWSESQLCSVSQLQRWRWSRHRLRVVLPVGQGVADGVTINWSSLPGGWTPLLTLWGSRRRSNASFTKHRPPATRKCLQCRALVLQPSRIR